MEALRRMPPWAAQEAADAVAGLLRDPDAKLREEAVRARAARSTGFGRLGIPMGYPFKLAATFSSIDTGQKGLRCDAMRWRSAAQGSREQDNAQSAART